MGHGAFLHATLALALGLCAQVVASRTGIPGIILLLGAGIVAGPDILDWLHPQALGSGMGDLVSLAVTVILFEGGLALRLEEVRAQQRSLTLLMLVGGAISLAVGTAAAHYFLALPWSISLLYGALMIVTGPTVVTPLLARIPLDRRVRELLIGEGVLIDPLGAIIAIVIAEAVLGHYAPTEIGAVVFLRLGIGGAMGAGAGIGLAMLLRRGLLPEELRNPVVLAGALFTAALASGISSEAGLMAAVVQGVVMGNAGLRDLGPLRQFKEELTVLLLSFIFVILAADLRLSAIADIGLPALAVVGAVIWVARPVAVAVSTVGSDLSFGERAFIAWICPRGIVAVSVAGLFAIQLREAGIEGGEALQALVFVTVAATVILQGTTAGRLANLLGIDQPTHQGTIIVGANYLGRMTARILNEMGRQVAVIDTNPIHGKRARDAGLPVFEGDARSLEVLEKAGAEYAYALLAVTANSELNTVVRRRVEDNFRIDRVLIASDEPDEHAGRRAFPGSFPGVDEVNRQIRKDIARLAVYRWQGDNKSTLDSVEFGPGAFALLLERAGSIYLASSDQTLQAGDRLVVLMTQPGQDPPVGFAVVHDTRALKPEGVTRALTQSEPDGAAKL